MPTRNPTDSFHLMCRDFVSAEKERLAAIVKGLLERHYPGEPLDLQTNDTIGPESNKDRPGPPMLRLAYHSLRSDDMALQGDAEDFLRLQNFYQFAVITHMMIVKEDRDEESVSVLLRRHGQKAAYARHAENREIAQAIKDWYKENHMKFRSLDAAAEAAMKEQPVSFRTARKHIGAAAREVIR